MSSIRVRKWLLCKA